MWCTPADATAPRRSRRSMSDPVGPVPLRSSPVPPTPRRPASSWAPTAPRWTTSRCSSCRRSPTSTTTAASWLPRGPSSACASWPSRARCARSRAAPGCGAGRSARWRASASRRPRSPRAELTALAASAATPGFVQALLRLVDELEEQRIEPGRWWAAMRAWGEREPARAAYAEELARLYGAYRDGLRAIGAPRPRAARPGRARRAAPGARALGRDAGLPLRLRRPARRCSATPSRRSPSTRRAPVTVSLAYEPGRAAFAGRGADVPGAHGPRPRARRAAGARRALRAPRAARARAHAVRAAARPGAPTPATRCCCSRAAASARSSSSSPPTSRG